MPLMVGFTFDPADPLRRCPGETMRANRAIRDYWEMGDSRSIRKLQTRYEERTRSESVAEKPPTRSISRLMFWSATYAWQSRIEAAQKIQDAEIEKLWIERRAKIREDDWTQGMALRDLANQMLGQSPNFYKTKRKYERGGRGKPDKEIVFLALDGNLMLRAASVGSQLTRLSAGLETERAAVEHSGSIAGLPQLDLANYDDSQLRINLGRIARAALALSIGINDPQPEGGNGADDPEGQNGGPALT